MSAGKLSIYRRIRRRNYWLFAVFLLFVADLVPISVGRTCGVALARLAVKLRAKEKCRALANIHRAFPDLDSSERNSLLAESVTALGKNFFDTLAVLRLVSGGSSVTEELNPETGNRPLVEIISDLAAEGKGVFVLGGHLGCWELFGGWLAAEIADKNCGPVAAVTGTIHNEPVDRLVQQRRQKVGLLTLPREAGVAPLLSHLQKSGVAAVLLDQNTRVQNMPVSFFGHPAPTPVGFGRMALKYGIPVIPVAIARTKDGHQVRHLAPLLPATNSEEKITEEILADFLRQCNYSLEQFIIRNPAEWVWFHKRWNNC